MKLRLTALSQISLIIVMHYSPYLSHCPDLKRKIILRDIYASEYSKNIQSLNRILKCTKWCVVYVPQLINQRPCEADRTEIRSVFRVNTLPTWVHRHFTTFSRLCTQWQKQGQDLSLPTQGQTGYLWARRSWHLKYSQCQRWGKDYISTMKPSLFVT